MISLVCVFEHILSDRDIAKYMGSFLDAEFKNDVRFSQSYVFFERVDFKSLKFVNFTIY